MRLSVSSRSLDSCSIPLGERLEDNCAFGGESSLSFLYTFIIVAMQRGKEYYLVNVKLNYISYGFIYSVSYSHNTYAYTCTYAYTHNMLIHVHVHMHIYIICTCRQLIQDYTSCRAQSRGWLGQGQFF